MADDCRELLETKGGGVMAGKVRERRLTVVDGFLTSRDFRSSFTKDDKAAGKRRESMWVPLWAKESGE